MQLLGNRIVKRRRILELEEKNKTFIDLKITKQHFKPDKPPKNSLFFYINEISHHFVHEINKEKGL